MPFNEDTFRANAKSEGHSDEEINNFIKGQKEWPSQPGVGIPEAPAKPTNAAQFYESEKAKQAQSLKDNEMFGAPEWMQVPAAAVAGGAAMSGINALLNRRKASATLDSAVGRIEPSIETPVNPVPVTPVEKAAVMADPLAEAKLRQANAQADLAEHRLKMAQKPSGVVPAPVAPSIAAPVAPTSFASAPAAPVAPPELPPGTAAQTKAATIPVTPIANAADPAALAQTVEKQADVAENLAPKPVEVVKKEPKIKGAVAPEMPQETLKTASGFNALVGQGESKKRVPTSFESVKDVPKDYAFIPGMDIGGTNYARQTLGQTGAIESARTIGQPFGPYTETQKVLKGLDQERVGPPATRDLRKSIGAPLPPNTTGLAGKAVKVGGVAGTLLLLSDLASAGQDVAKGDFSKAGGKAAEALSSFFPGFQGATFSKGAGEGEQEQIDYLRRIEEAKRKGAGNRGSAYDPRKFYTPMDGSVPPPLR